MRASLASPPERLLWSSSAISDVPLVFLVDERLSFLPLREVETASPVPLVADRVWTWPRRILSSHPDPFPSPGSHRL